MKMNKITFFVRILILQSLLLFSCSKNDKKFGPYTFLSGCNGGVFLCDQWIKSYFKYKSWLKDYPLSKDIENGTWVDQNQNLIRDDIDCFIDEVISKDYKFLDDMISLLRQYARIHGQYSRMEFSEEKAKFFFKNDYTNFVHCKESFLGYEKLFGVFSGVFYQISHLLISHDKTKNFLLYLMFARRKQEQIPFLSGILEYILLMPKNCNFSSKNSREIFTEFKKRNPGNIRLLQWEKTIQLLESKHGTKYRYHYENFNSEK